MGCCCGNVGTDVPKGGDCESCDCSSGTDYYLINLIGIEQCPYTGQDQGDCVKGGDDWSWRWSMAKGVNGTYLVNDGADGLVYSGGKYGTSFSVAGSASCCARSSNIDKSYKQYGAENIWADCPLHPGMAGRGRWMCCDTNTLTFTLGVSSDCKSITALTATLSTDKGFSFDHEKPCPKNITDHAPYTDNTDRPGLQLPANSPQPCGVCEYQSSNHGSFGNTVSARIFEFDGTGGDGVRFGSGITNELTSSDCDAGGQPDGLCIPNDDLVGANVVSIGAGTSEKWANGGTATVVKAKADGSGLVCKPKAVRVTFGTRTACTSCGQWSSTPTYAVPVSDHLDDSVLTISDGVSLTAGCTKYQYTAEDVLAAKVKIHTSSPCSGTVADTELDSDVYVTIAWFENKWTVYQVIVVEKDADPSDYGTEDGFPLGRHFNTGTGNWDMGEAIDNGYDEIHEACGVGHYSGYYGGTVTVEVDES